MVSPKWQIAGYHENTMIRGWLIVHPRGRGGDDGLLKNPRFPPFFRRCWMLLDGEKRTNGAGDGNTLVTTNKGIACHS